MVSFKIEWKFPNGRRGSEVVHTSDDDATDPVKRAAFLSRMSLTVVPYEAKMVNWTILANAGADCTNDHTATA